MSNIICRTGADIYLPILSEQEEMFKIYDIEPTLSEEDFNQRTLFRIRGKLDDTRLVLAWQAMLRKYNLRNIVLESKKRSISSEIVFNLVHTDELNVFLNPKDCGAVFYRENETDAYLKVNISHCWIDAHSNRLMFETLSEAYRNDHSESIQCEVENLHKRIILRSAEFSGKYDSEFSKILDRTKVNIYNCQSYESIYREDIIGKNTSDLILSLKDRYSCSNFKLFCAAYTRFLSETFDLDNVIFYYPKGLRDKEEKELFGYYVSVGIAIIEGVKEKSFSDLVRYFKDYLDDNPGLRTNDTRLRLKMLKLHNNGYPRFVLSATTNGAEFFNLGEGIEIFQERILRDQVFDSFRFYLNLFSSNVSFEFHKDLGQEKYLINSWKNIEEILFRENIYEFN